MSDITRAVAIRRGLRSLEAITMPATSASFQVAFCLELGRAFDAGHIAGSGVKNQTDAEQHLAEVARGLTNYQGVVISETISPELGDALLALIEIRETEPCPIPGSEFDVGVDL